MLEIRHDPITTDILELLKRRPSAFDPQRWIPRLVDEIERLRHDVHEPEDDRLA
jgi:hypothetical protein